MGRPSYNGWGGRFTSAYPAHTSDDFGVLGSFAALLGIISVVSALRYQIPILLSDDVQEAANRLVVSPVCRFVVSGLTVLAVVLLGDRLVAQFSTPAMDNVLWMLPIDVLLAGAYAIFPFWSTRKAYPQIARTRIEQAIGCVGRKSYGAGVGAIGLITGQVISIAAGVLGLVRRAWAESKAIFTRVRIDALRRTAYTSRHFPIYSGVESLENTGGL